MLMMITLIIAIIINGIIVNYKTFFPIREKKGHNEDVKDMPWETESILCIWTCPRSFRSFGNKTQDWKKGCLIENVNQ